MNQNVVKKSLAVVLACSLAAMAFAGCSKTPTDEGEYLTDADGKKTKITSIATIEGEPVTLSEFKAAITPMKASYELQFGGTEIWTQAPDMFAALKDSALESIRMDRVVEKFAEENKLTLTPEDKAKKVDEYIAEAKEQFGGEEEFAKQLEAAGMTPETYRAMIDRQIYSIVVTDEMTNANGIFAPTDEELTASFQADYLHAKHILVSFESMDNNEEAALERANEAYARAQKGESFDALVTEYGTDPGMQATPEGYYFTDGEMVTEFYEGTKALAENAISQPIKSSYGYHVIQRLPLEDAYFAENKEQLKITKGSKKVNDEMMARMEATPIEKTAEFELITIDNIGI